MCVAWALLDLSTLPTLHVARSLSVPLRGGPLALRWTLQQCAAAAQAQAAQLQGRQVSDACPTCRHYTRLAIHPPVHQQGMHSKLALTACPQAALPKRTVKSALPFTLKPVPAVDAAAALLPRLALASAPAARVVSLYRQLLAEALGTPEASEGGGRGRRETKHCWCRSEAGPPARCGHRVCSVGLPPLLVHPLARAPPRWRRRQTQCWPASLPCWTMSS